MSYLFDTGIRPVIDDYLKKKSEEERDYGDYWSASSAGYCMRLNIMRQLGVPKVPELEDSAALTRIFESGHIFHEWMQRITKDAGLSIASEVELQDEDLMIRGHFDDLVITNKQPDNPGSTTGEFNNGIKPHLILYDYKTAHSASFNYSKNRPMGHYHTMQLGTYMYMLRKKSLGQVSWAGANVDPNKLDLKAIMQLEEARILSISKDDLRMDEKQLIWSEDLEKKITDYWGTLNDCWAIYQEDGLLPVCTCLEHDGGFMGRRSSKGKIYNDYFYNDEPCSQKWFNKWKEADDRKSDSQNLKAFKKEG